MIKKTSALILSAISIPAYAGLFGYYHADPAGVLATQDHTNVVYIQTANPTQPIDQIAATHPTAKMIVEFGILNIRLRGQDGCRYGKCMDFDADLAREVLDAVEQHIIKPYRSRLAALMIIDEIETNPESVIAAESLIDAIRARPAFDGIALWANFDNVWRWSTGHEFVIPRGLDWVSVTPAYGRTCFYGLCEDSKYSILSKAAKQHVGLKLAVVGDGWAQSSDVDLNGELSTTGQAHKFKIEALWELAGQQGMEVVGYFPFAYSAPGPYVISTAPAVIKQAWADAWRKVMAGAVLPPADPPPTAPFPTWTPPSWLFDLKW